MNGYVLIKSITHRGDGTCLVKAETGNESGSEELEFIIICEIFDELGLATGAASCEVLPLLERGSKLTAAYFSACSSFAFSQSSLKAIYRKLVAKGFSKEIAQDAIELVRDREFVDEDEIAVRRAEIMIAKLWGKTRIISKLREEGFPDYSIEEAFEYLSGVDFVSNCILVIEKKYGEIPEERIKREKMYAALSRMGYSSSEIKAAVMRILEDQ